jgi:hypothetical protein
VSRRPRILVISFSPIHRDARVLREISALAEIGEVTSAGYGTRPPHVVDHLRIPDGAPSLPQTPAGVAGLALRRLRACELAAPAARETIRLVGGREFDVVVANDARAIPTAFAVARGAPVWADMHEWAPEERTHVMSWRLLVAPLMDHICREYLPRCAAVTTVAASIADLYLERYGVAPRLVRNAAPYADLEPSALREDGAIRLVHSGGAVAGRNIETMIDAVKAAAPHLTLDLYLVPGNDGGSYLRALHRRAHGCARITFHDPVAPAELARTLNEYDVGIYWIPPYSTNARLALPNKIFDFIQARLAVAAGPTLEMARIINGFDIGVVTEDFEPDSIVAALNALTPAEVAACKSRCARAAHELSFEHEASTIREIVGELAPR